MATFTNPIKRKIEKFHDKHVFIVHTAWQDVFSTPASPSNTIVPKQYTERTSLSANTHYLADSLFYAITSSSIGGALCCNTSSSSTKLLIESSSFTSCHTSGNYLAGAIYFKSGQCCKKRCII